MTYSISENKKVLTLFASQEDRNTLGSHFSEYNQFDYVLEIDLLEDLIANSDLDWIGPEECGDLTDAPILGYRDEEGKATGERWGFMDYQVKSFLSDLCFKGEAKFQAPIYEIPR